MGSDVFEQFVRLANELEEVQGNINSIIQHFNDYERGTGDPATVESLHTLSYFETFTFKVTFKFFTDSVKLEDREVVSEAKVIINMTNKDGTKNETKSVSITDESINSLDVVALGVITKMFLL